MTESSSESENTFMVKRWVFPFSKNFFSFYATKNYCILQELMKIWLQLLWQIRMEIMLDVPAHIVQFAGIEMEKCVDNTVLLADDKTEGIFMRSLIWKLLENTGIGKC